jgi:hypothetical protein
MIYEVHLLFDGTTWTAQTMDGQYSAFALGAFGAIMVLQTRLPPNPDGTPAVIKIG